MCSVQCLMLTVLWVHEPDCGRLENNVLSWKSILVEMDEALQNLGGYALLKKVTHFG